MLLYVHRDRTDKAVTHKIRNFRVQCRFAPTETVRTIRHGKPWTATSIFTQLLSSDTVGYAVQVQCCFTSTETIRTIRAGESRKSISTFTQLSLSSILQNSCSLTFFWLVIVVTDTCLSFKNARQFCVSCLSVPNSPHCLCGRKAKLNSETALTVRRFGLAVRLLVGKKNLGSIPLRLSHTHTDSRQNVTPTWSYSYSRQFDTNMIIQRQYAIQTRLYNGSRHSNTDTIIQRYATRD